MKCTLCAQRKGKRFCPAGNNIICAQCCGEKRVLEIECPEGCEYLKAGRAQEAAVAGELFFRTSDRMEHAKRVRVLEQFETVFSEIQGVIAVERQSDRQLTDGDAAEAADCLLKTLRTEERGILYETTSGNLRADGLRRQLSDIIQLNRYPEEPDRPRLSLSDAIQCMEVLRAVVANHLESARGVISFVDFLARQLPRKQRSGSFESSLIIPGR